MEGQINMYHEHVKIVVIATEPPGAEVVPARNCDNEIWEILKSPLYATEVAAGDIIKVVDKELGTFEMIRRGGNVCVQFYLPINKSDCVNLTSSVAEFIEEKLETIGGSIDGRTIGLITCTLPISLGFQLIEDTFIETVSAFPGSQWQFGNVYDPTTGEPLNWW
jgi:hypothetical protein